MEIQVDTSLWSKSNWSSARRKEESETGKLSDLIGLHLSVLEPDGEGEEEKTHLHFAHHSTFLLLLLLLGAETSQTFIRGSTSQRAQSQRGKVVYPIRRKVSSISILLIFCSALRSI